MYIRALSLSLSLSLSLYVVEGFGRKDGSRRQRV